MAHEDKKRIAKHAVENLFGDSDVEYTTNIDSLEYIRDLAQEFIDCLREEYD